jgi:hypothetical protein
LTAAPPLTNILVNGFLSLNPLRYSAFKYKCFSGFSKVACSGFSKSSSLALNLAETLADALPLPLSTICLISRLYASSDAIHHSSDVELFFSNSL